MLARKVQGLTTALFRAKSISGRRHLSLSVDTCTSQSTMGPLVGDLEWIFSQDNCHVDISVREAPLPPPASTENVTSTASTPNSKNDQSIPENVLQYERQLRKTQANQRSNSALTPEEHLKIIYEDDALLVADKVGGVLCVPGLHNKPSLLELVYQYCGQPMPQSAQMIVHRLDMDTSGLVVFAKTLVALRALQAAFRDRFVEKEYHALVCGHFPEGLETGHVHLPLQRDHQNPPFMRIATPASEIEAARAVEDLRLHGFAKLIKKRPKPSHTEFRILSREYYKHATVGGDDDDSDEHSQLLPVTRLSLIPHTGRTHQLRVHCAALGYPIVGDPAYGIYGEASPRGGLFFETDATAVEQPGGGASLELQKALNARHTPTHEYPMCLHATKLSLKHPLTGETQAWEAPTLF
jgi:tRNA pseudouridine32 synthase/23S rRNA pseudouridine746 synthase